MNGTASGVVINLNAYGATVRLDDGDLATASASDVEAHRDRYQHSLVRRKRLPFEVGRHFMLNWIHEETTAHAR